MPSPSDLHTGKCPPLRSSPRQGGAPSLGLPPRLHFACLILCVICTSCGAVGSSSIAPPPATVTVTPNSAKPFPGGQQQFQAMVENASNSAVNWQVKGTQGEIAGVGTIDSTGLYTAPSVVPSQPTVTVTAVLQSDATKTGSASVTIQSFSAYTGPLVVSPALSSVTTSQTLQLQILTPGISNSDVSWLPTGGTISASGLFTPPSAPGAYIIVASLGNVTATATVEVTNFPGTLTWRNDNMRSGVNNQELALAPGTVNSAKFGKLFSCPIDGYAYAQPLYVPNLAIPGNGIHNVIFVVTEMDSVFAFDADANSKPCLPLWKTSLIPAGSQAIATPNFEITSTDLVPFVGITGTPVIAASASLLYVVAATETAAVNPVSDHRLYALDLATGQPQILPGGADISPLPGQQILFAPTQQNQRAALLLDNGTVYIAYGSYGGLGDSYHGWLFAYDASSLRQTGVFNVTPGSSQGGIWQSGGGPSSDSIHNVFASTGNGTFDLRRRLSTYSNSFLKFANAGGLSLADYFTPCNEATLGASGLSVGSGALVLLPDSAGSALQPHLLIGGSTGGTLYVVNRDNMGQFAGACPDSPARVQTIPVGNGPILSTPLFWNGAVYVAPGNANLQSFSMSQGILAPSPSAAQSPEMLGPQGATPVISSSGTNNAILWLIDSSGALATPKNTPAILRAYDPNNLSNEIYNSTMAASLRDAAGLAVKFSVPTVANGKVYVGTQTEMDVYGLLP